MRGVLLLLTGLLPALLTAADHPDLAAALRGFRSEVPPDWSYVQTTSDGQRSLEERHDATRPDFARWILLRRDGRAPTSAELAEYRDARSRRSRGGTAPRLAEQIDPAAATVLAEANDRTTYRCRLRPAEAGDRTADFLHATVVVHRPSRTIAAITLENDAAFNPALGIHITKLRTRLTFSLPAGERPSLPQTVETSIRGNAYWFKSLDADLQVTFSAYEPYPRTPAP
ncbi:MAG: hypothetical protein ACO3G4_11900 [Opitutaceae bacterium]